MALNSNFIPSQQYLKRLIQSQLYRFNSSYTAKRITKKVHIHKHTEKASIYGKQTPLCLILGWGNSKQSQLNKYSEIYEERGFNTITVSPLLIDALVFPQIKGKKISYQVLDTIRSEFEGENIPILFHQFSNGGCALYYFICEELLKQNSIYGKKVKIVGTVFDSCPVVPNFESIQIAQQVFSNELSNPLLKTFVWYSARLFLPFLIWLNPIVKLFMKSLENFPDLSPQLFFYSKIDTFAPYKDIEKFIKSRQEKGVRTMVKCWSDTPHVRHLMYDQEGYVEMIDKFIKRLSF